MTSYTNEQHVQMIKLYYQNECSIMQTLLALRPFYGRRGGPSKSTLQRLVANFEKTGSVNNLPVQQDINDDLEDESSSSSSDETHIGNFDEVFIKQEAENDDDYTINANSCAASNIGEKHLENKIIKKEFEDNIIYLNENPLSLGKKQPNDLNYILPDKAPKEKTHIDDPDASSQLTAAVDPKKPYQCDECDKTYSHNVSLYRHKRTHTGEKPHKCDICSKAFYRKSILTDHKRTHTVEKPNKSTDSESRPHKCNICGRSFTSSIQLDKHVPVHTGETSFKCDICDLNFVSKHHLNSHNQTHTNERPFKCEICEVTYKSANGLKEHMSKHTGEKPV